MKKFFAIIASLVLFSAAASAQAGSRAIGLRGGYGVEISYQYGNDNRFLEADLGWSPESVNIVGVMDFVFAHASVFNFYAGPGAHVGIFRYNDGQIFRSALSLGIVGQIGVEYPFPTVPLNISLDWRPAFNFIGNVGFKGAYAAVGIRYRF